MPATPREHRTPPWLKGMSKSDIASLTQEQHATLMNEYMAKEYEGLSRPIVGDDIYELEDPVWALKNLIQEDGLTILHGQPGSFKSFIAMDWAYSLSASKATSWMGQPRAKQFRPMYLFTEGMHGLKNRSLAWSAERGIPTPSGDEAVVWIRDRVGLNATADPEQPFTRQVASLVKMYNDYRCDILFVDTLANTFVGNENQQQDANSYLRTLSLFLEGGPVVLVHHNKKGEDEFRGSTVFHGAVDTLVSMKKVTEGTVNLSISKQKDGPENFFLNLKAVEHRWAGKFEEQTSIALADETPDYWMKDVHYDILTYVKNNHYVTVQDVSEVLKAAPQTMKSRLDTMVKRGKLLLLEDTRVATYTLNEAEEI